MQAMDRFSFAGAGRLVALAGMLLGSAASLAQVASERKLIVADIVISGNKRTATDAIKGLLKSRVGGEYVVEAVQEDVRTLMATKQFRDVEARYSITSGNKVTLSFFVDELPNVVEEVVYEGVRSLKKGELERLTAVRKGAPLNPAQNRLACQSIVNRLRDKGRHFASCVLKEGDKPGDKRVVFAVTEGPEIYIRSIEFEGNHFVSGAVLKTHISSKERLLGLFASLGTPYIPAVADHDVDELLKYYRSYGFHDVRVSRQTRWDADSGTVVLIFHILEGQRYRLQGPPTPDSELSRSREELSPLIQAKSYEYYSEDTTKTGVHFQVSEQPPARVGQIFIVGNTPTRQNVITHQVPLYHGQPLSYPAIEQSTRNLAKLSIFESTPEVHPDVTVIDSESASPYKDILINVQKTRTNSLMFGQVSFTLPGGITLRFPAR